MASLVDLLNPTFFMFLGIIILVASLLIVYFESKLREEKRNMQAMLSLVTTIAGELNNVKMELSSIAYNGGQRMEESLAKSEQPIIKKSLIEVSDDEEDEDEDEDDDTSNNSDSDDDESSKASEIKVIKINMTENLPNDDDTNMVLELDAMNEDEDENEDEIDCDDLPEINYDYVDQVLDLKCEDLESEKEVPKPESEQKDLEMSELKTISINLGEEYATTEPVNYKKLQLNSLRKIVLDKSLVSSETEVNKLKKHDLLKLLGIE